MKLCPDFWWKSNMQLVEMGEIRVFTENEELIRIIV